MGVLGASSFALALTLFERSARIRYRPVVDDHSSAAHRRRPLQRPKSVIAVALLLLGLLAIGTAASTSSTSHTRDGRLTTDVRVGLASSPLYTSHREAPVGGVTAAIDRGQPVVVVSNTRWDWFSWSGLLALFGLAATTFSVVTLIRTRERE